MFDNIIDIIFVCYQSDNDLTNNGAIRPLFISGDMDNLIQDFKHAKAKSAKVEPASEESVRERKVKKRKHHHRRSSDEPSP